MMDQVQLRAVFDVEASELEVEFKLLAVVHQLERVVGSSVDFLFSSFVLCFVLWFVFNWSSMVFMSSITFMSKQRIIVLSSLSGTFSVTVAYSIQVLFSRLLIVWGCFLAS